MNKVIGEIYENKLIKLLSENGFWCHVFAHKYEGQPCDIVALRNDTGILIDSKHCSVKRFPFADIRPNQKTCFALAKQKGNTLLGFAIYFDEIQDWRWLGYIDLLKMEQEGLKSVSYKDLPKLF